jgi:hypothetical protein
MAFQINTSSGGSIDLNLHNDRFSGLKLYLHIDQNSNLHNGEGEAAIHLTNDEVKALIGMLNDYIIYSENSPYVLLADPLLDDRVTIKVDK